MSRLTVVAHVMLVLSLSSASAEPLRSDLTPPRGGPPSEAQLDFGLTQGLVLRSLFPDSELRFHFATWMRWNTKLANDDVESQLAIPLARPVVEAFFFDKKVHAFIQEEFSGRSARLLDLWLDFKLGGLATLRVGQFRTPYTRAFITPIIQLLFPDRGVVADAFRLGRDTGAMLHGRLQNGAFEYYLGVFGGETTDAPSNLDPSVWPALRLVYNVGAPVSYDQVPAARKSVATGLAIGVNAAYQRRAITADPSLEVTKESWHGGGDLAFASGRLAATAEGFLRYERFESGPWQRAWGAFAQGGVFVLPRTVELAARVGVASDEFLGDESPSQTYEVGLNGYAALNRQALGHHLKAMLRYGVSRTKRMEAFETETAHQITAQGQLWF